MSKLIPDCVNSAVNWNFKWTTWRFLGWASSHFSKLAGTSRWSAVISQALDRCLRWHLTYPCSRCPLQISENQSEVLHLFRWYTHTYTPIHHGTGAGTSVEENTFIHYPKHFLAFWLLTSGLCFFLQTTWHDKQGCGKQTYSKCFGVDLQKGLEHLYFCESIIELETRPGLECHITIWLVVWNMFFECFHIYI